MNPGHQERKALRVTKVARVQLDQPVLKVYEVRRVPQDYLGIAVLQESWDTPDVKEKMDLLVLTDHPDHLACKVCQVLPVFMERKVIGADGVYQDRLGRQDKKVLQV